MSSKTVLSRPARGVLLACAVVLAAGGLGILVMRSPAGDPTLGTADLISPRLIGLHEASGITFHPTLDRLYVVGDRGDLVELSTCGLLLRRALVGGDLEDIAVHSPSGELVALAENEAELVRIDPQSLSVLGRCTLDREKLPGGEGESNGFEGLTFLPQDGETEGLLLLAQQRRPPQILSLAFDPTSCARAPLGERVEQRRKYRKRGSLSALSYVALLGRTLALDGERRELLVLDAGGKVAQHIAVPCLQPEGLCVDARGALWIADDRRGLWRFPSALSRLAALLATKPAAPTVGQ